MRRPKPSTSRPRASSALKRPIVLVGLMGAGKSSIGRLVASRLGLEFVDADTEIERAAHANIEDIFESHGEAAFRSGERRVIARLLVGPVRIIATGGGAFMDDETRRKIEASAHSVWLKAKLETLLTRVARRGGRPLVKNKDARTVLAALMAERDPIYATADITVETSENPPTEVAERVIKALESHLGVGPLTPAGKPAKARGRTTGAKGLSDAAANNAAKPPRRAGPGRRNRRAGGRQEKSPPGNRS